MALAAVSPTKAFVWLMSSPGGDINLELVELSVCVCVSGEEKKVRKIYCIWEFPSTLPHLFKLAPIPAAASNHKPEDATWNHKPNAAGHVPPPARIGLISAEWRPGGLNMELGRPGQGLPVSVKRMGLSVHRVGGCVPACWRSDCIFDVTPCQGASRRWTSVFI